jgi:hypothetical protein
MDFLGMVIRFKTTAYIHVITSIRTKFDQYGKQQGVNNVHATFENN